MRRMKRAANLQTEWQIFINIVYMATNVYEQGDPKPQLDADGKCAAIAA